MIITFGNRKGGVGKSQTVINLAGAMVNRGYDVMVLDADNNNTVVQHMARREATNATRVANNQPELKFINSADHAPEDALTRTLDRYKKDYDFVLVDTGGFESFAFKTAVTKSDVIYLPFQACQGDIEQIEPTLQVIQEIEMYRSAAAGGGLIDTRLIITKVQHHSRDMKKEAMELCTSLLNIASISDVVIKEIKAIRKCQEDGTTLSDPDVNGRLNPNRVMFELLLDEIQGTRKMRHTRENTDFEAVAI